MVAAAAAMPSSTFVPAVKLRSMPLPLDPVTLGQAAPAPPVEAGKARYAPLVSTGRFLSRSPSCALWVDWPLSYLHRRFRLSSASSSLDP